MPADPREPNRPSDPAAQTAPPDDAAPTGRMHRDVPYWSDPVCSCEAEPYWEEQEEPSPHEGQEEAGPR